MQKLFKNPLFTFIIGFIMAVGITVVFAYDFNAQNVEYLPSDSSWNVDNTKTALDSLYEKNIGMGETLTNYKYVHTLSATNTIDLNLEKGYYLCDAEFNYTNTNCCNASYQTTNGHVGTIAGCDDLTNVINLGNQSGAAAKYGNTHFQVIRVRTNFRCEVFNDKTISASYGKSITYTTEMGGILDISCTKIRKF